LAWGTEGKEELCQIYNINGGNKKIVSNSYWQALGKDETTQGTEDIKQNLQIEVMKP
jgi:hypothetical protein